MSGFDLKALQDKKLPRCGAMDIFKAHDAESEAAAKEHLDAYFAEFLVPAGDFHCIGCHRTLTGFLGSFAWGLANGEGHCAECGYPVRMLHRFKDGPVEHLTMPMQYHPDELSGRKSATDEVSP